MDPFEVLGVTPDTPRDEVRAAYRRLARRHHPDLHADAPPDEQVRHERRMAEVTSAWRLINDPAALARHRARSARAGTAPNDDMAANGRARDGGGGGFDYRRAAPSEFDVPMSGTWDRTPPRTPRPDPTARTRRAGTGRTRTGRTRTGRARRPVLWLAILVAIVVGVVLLGFTDPTSADPASADPTSADATSADATSADSAGTTAASVAITAA